MRTALRCSVGSRSTALDRDRPELVDVCRWRSVALCAVEGTCVKKI